MPTITFTYQSKCPAADPHIHLLANVNGQPKMQLGYVLSDLWQGAVSDDDAAVMARVLLLSFVRRWKRDNPAGTLPQLRTALEAEEWVI